MEYLESMDEDALRMAYAYHEGLMRGLDDRMAGARAARDRIVALMGREPDLPGALRRSGHAQVDPPGGFNPGWTWAERFLFFIRRAGRPLPARELRDWAMRHDPGYFDRDRRHGPAPLDQNLSRAHKTGRISKVTIPGRRGAYYFPPSWADAHGDLLPEYLGMIL